MSLKGKSKLILCSSLSSFFNLLEPLILSLPLSFRTLVFLIQAGLAGRVAGPLSADGSGHPLVAGVLRSDDVSFRVST